MQLKDVAPSCGVATLLALAVFFLKFLPISNWGILPIQIVVGVAICHMICKAAKIEEYTEITKILLTKAKIPSRKR